MQNFNNFNQSQFNLAYAQSAILVLAIQNLYGKQTLLNIYKNLKNNEKFSVAFYNATSQSLDEFNHLVYEYIKNRYWWFKLITLPNQLFTFFPLLLVIGFVLRSRHNKKIKKQWELEEELEEQLDIAEED